MNKKLLAVIVLGFVFSINAVSAKPNGNGNGKGPKESKMEDDVGVAAATTAKPNHPKADMHKGTFYVPCVEVETTDEEGFIESHYFVHVKFQQQGSSNNWKPVEADLAGPEDEIIDCQDALELFEE